jgi:cytochrome bd-type quinol oxidase subunit 2
MDPVLLARIQFGAKWPGFMERVGNIALPLLAYAASAPESLFIILVGSVLVLLFILAYTAFSYYVFRGKATELRYD